MKERLASNNVIFVYGFLLVGLFTFACFLAFGAKFGGFGVFLVALFGSVLLFLLAYAIIERLGELIKRAERLEELLRQNTRE
jgi:hypothetical protein